MKETRADILKVARRAFATIGFQKTTIEAIARMANRGRRTVYTYFKNKTEIYTAVVEMEIREIVDSLDSVCTEDSSLEKNLGKYARLRTQKLSELLCRNPMLRRSFLSKHSRIEKLRDTLEAEETLILTRIISKYHARDISLSDYEASDLARVFQTMLRSADILIGNNESTIVINKYIDLNCRIFINGIGSGKTKD